MVVPLGSMIITASAATAKSFEDQGNYRTMDGRPPVAIEARWR
jgi:hypothetical protein